MVLRLATFPGGEDPDEMLRLRGKEKFSAAIEQAVPATDFLLEMALAGYDNERPEKRQEAMRDVVEVIAMLETPQERAHYVGKAAARMCSDDPRKLAIFEGALLDQVRQARAVVQKPEVERQLPVALAMDGLEKGVFEAERSVLWAMLEQPELANELSDSLSVQDFNHPDHIRIANKLFSITSVQGLAIGKSLGEEDEGLAPLLASVALQGDGIQAVADREIIEGYVKTITDFRKERRWIEIQEAAVKCLEEGSGAENASLFEEYKELTRYLAGGATKQDRL
jgi:DNA primase